MKSNNKGFIMSTYVYVILVFFLLLLGTMLLILNNTKLLSDKLRNQVSPDGTTSFAFDLKGDKNYYIFKGYDFEDPGYVALSSGNKDLSDKIKTKGTVNTNKIGKYKLTYTLSYNGQTKKIARNVYVVSTDVDITYSGDYAIYTALNPGYYRVETWGAEGGATVDATGGKGAYVDGVIQLERGEKLYVYVGGKGISGKTAVAGSTPVGGYNGGGNGYVSRSTCTQQAASGGGSTDVRYFGTITPTKSDLLWSSDLGLNSRIMVAAGGGGAFQENCSTNDNSTANGGAGGILNGIAGTYVSHASNFSNLNPTGGTQNTGGQSLNEANSTSYSTTYIGKFGAGATGTESYGGGGAGYYGGASGKWQPGGGGSSLISGYAGVNTITGSEDRTHAKTVSHYSGKYFIDNHTEVNANVGNGKAKISYIGTSAPEKTNPRLEDVRYIKACAEGNGVNADNRLREIQAIKDGVNILKGVAFKKVAGTEIAAGTYNDGDISTLNALSSTTDQCVVVDLGEVTDLDEVATIYDWDNNYGKVKNAVTYVSADNENWKILMMNESGSLDSESRVTAWDEEFDDGIIEENGSITFTKNYNVYTVPATGYYKVETWGAQGGTYDTYEGGKGGYASGYIHLNAGEKLYIYVGRQGITADQKAAYKVFGGYNGGGDAYGTTDKYVTGGGGATDIRYFGNDYTPSNTDLVWNSALGLSSRIMVAGGGGGNAMQTATVYGIAAPGGNLIASNAKAVGGSPTLGAGATQKSAGTGVTSNSGFGVGGSATSNGTAGGAGYYGGGAGQYYSGGGGGSSFISGYAGVNAITSSTNRAHTANTNHYSNKYFVAGEMEVGVNEGDGKATITYAGPELPKTNAKLNNVRYIKDCINGSSANTANHWVELQAIANGTNVAKGKTVTGTVAQNGSYPYSRITDGDITVSNYSQSNAAGYQCITIDLGEVYDLDEIAVWHYYSDNRTYKENTTYVSHNNATWVKVIETEEPDTSDGKRITAWDGLQASDTVIFNYLGDYQTFTASRNGYYKIDAYGAQGGTGSKAAGGKGALTSGYVYLNRNEKLYIYVGGQPSSIPNTAYNGGGASGTNTSYPSHGGGGATDVRYFGSTTPTAENLVWNSDLGLNSRIMVAAGGGGSYNYDNTYKAIGGAGGTLLGANGIATKQTPAIGGTQTSGGIGNNANSSYNGSFGQGGNAASGLGTGGGGGYYGGGGTYNIGSSAESGSGGSSFISGYAGVNAITSSSNRTHTNNTKHYSNKYFIDAEMESGVNSGNGSVEITYAGDALERKNTALNGVRYVKDCINGNTVDSDNRWTELQVIKDGVNLAKGKNVTGTSSQNSEYPYSYITDGIIDNNKYGQSSNTGLQCITIDLGSSYDVDEIAVWHYFDDDRAYASHTTQVSKDNSTWLLVIDDDSSTESSYGNRVDVWDEPIKNNYPIKLFYYNENYQEFIAPSAGYYFIKAWGAKGANDTYGAKGGYTEGAVYLNKNEKLYIYIGARGLTQTNIKRFNAGTGSSGGYNGGGATDIRYFGTHTPTADELAWDSVLGINSRIMVAGGGGSASGGKAGSGGLLIAEKGNGTAGGTQTSFAGSNYTASAFGIANGGCTGGNGYYPGAGATCNSGAGGGSSFISGYAGVNAITSSSDRTHTGNTLHYSGKYFVAGDMQSGVRSGDGRVSIGYIGTSIPRTNTKLNNVRYIKDCINGSTANTTDHWVELQAIANGTNVAKGKIPTGTSVQNGSYPYSRITDGDITTSNYAQANVAGNQCITIDLENTYNLDEIAVWHYYGDVRTYKDNILSVSTDNEHWVEVINSYEQASSQGKHATAYE